MLSSLQKGLTLTISYNFSFSNGGPAETGKDAYECIVFFSTSNWRVTASMLAQRKKITNQPKEKSKLCIWLADT